MPARYVLWPGRIHSRSDRDVHYIGVGQLLTLYMVPPAQRWVIGGLRGFVPRTDDINCAPRFDGQYPAFSMVRNTRPILRRNAS